MFDQPDTEGGRVERAQAGADEPVGEYLRLRVAGLNDLGDPIEFVAVLDIQEGATGEERLENAGLVFRNEGDDLFIDDVAFGSAAATAGLDWDQQVLRVLKPANPPSKYLMFIPALLLLAGVVFLQRGRAPKSDPQPATA